MAIALFLFKKKKKKRSQNGYFSRKKNGAIGIKLLHADTTSFSELHGVSSIWPQLFLFVYNAKNVQNGTSKKNNFDLITCSLCFLKA